MKKNFLKEIREEKGIKASELARLAGVSRQNIYGYEKGVGISNEILIKLADILGVSANQILTGKESRQESEIKSECLAQAMEMAYKAYEDDNFDRLMMIKIASEIYNLMIAHKKIKDPEDKKNFSKILQDKMAIGLAAKCFADYIL
jgi:transcriptional regulator with XRE-family HTH domain